MLEPLASLDEANFHPLVQGSGDPVQHRQRMAFIVGILQTADDRGRGPDEFGQLALRQAHLDAEGGNLPRHTIVGPRLLKCRNPCRSPFIIAAMKNFDRVCGRQSFTLRHGYASRYVCRSGDRSNFCLLWAASSISRAGTTRSLTRPWARTAAIFAWEK